MKEIKSLPDKKTKKNAIFIATKIALTVLFLILNISVMVTKGERLEKLSNTKDFNLSDFDLPEEIINEDSYVFSDNWKLL